MEVCVIITGGPCVHSINRLGLIIILVLANIVVLAQTQRPAPAGIIQGIVQSGGTAVPGVTITATNTATNEKFTTSSDLNGQYQLRLAAIGSYSVETSMAAFAPSTKTAEISDASAPVRMDFDLTLSSRTQNASAQPRQTVGFRGRGAQTLQARQTETSDASQENQSEEVPAQIPNDAQVPGFAQDAPTESVAVLGNTAESTFGNNFNFDREQIQQLIDQQFGQGGRGGPEGFGAAQNGGPGGPGGFAGGGRGGGNQRGGGGRGFAFGRGGRGFGTTRPRGNLSYTLADSALDAAPYSLTGQPGSKPEYLQNRFSASIGGPLVIPKLVKSTTTNYTFTYTGTRNRNPYDVFSTVPTLLERTGDFSQSMIRNGVNAGNPVQIFDPVTHAAILDNVLPQSMLNPAALGLLQFIPKPNLPSIVQNFHYVTSTTNNSNDFNIRLNHTLGTPLPQQGQGVRGGGGRGGGFGGGRGGGGGRGRGSNINFGLQYRSGNSALNNPFPTIGGTNNTSGVNATLGFVRPIGRLINQLNLNYNRNRTTATNLYAFQQDIGSLLGIAGISQNPFDWGVPNLSFTNFSGLNDVRSSLRRDQTVQISDGMIWNRGQHNVRWGTDFRLQQTNTHSTQNSRGTFTFTGARTAAVVDGAPVQGTGYDLADFLLGLPQSTSLQYGNLTYNFRGNSWDIYVQDDWRLRGNLTINLGLRYDYASPFIETGNQIANLDVSPGFTTAVPVLPGQVGPFHGTFPRSLVKPDRNNFSPRFGIAWRIDNRTVLRSGYGITYNSAAYTAIALQMANQPPFSLTQTNTIAELLTLQNGFPPLPSTVTNNYGIDPNYRIGYAQQWNLDVQRDVRKLGVQVNLDYTGTKGTRLDVIQAPNRTATGLRIADVQPFNWETSAANSILHSAAVRVRRRLGRGISAGGTYQFSKSIDNASTVSGGGGGGTVAQDAFDLRAERGLSNFDRPHRLSLDYNFELPFGTNKPFLAEKSFLKTVFGDWQLNGSWNIMSGLPATARVLGSFTDVARGSNGSLRANATGLPIGISDPGVAEWFNTAAFTLPAPGQFGNVGRNTIRLPATILGNLSLNKTFPFADGRSIDVRAQASNIFNTPQFNTVDTTVNSPSFGRVTSVGQMRRMQIVARFNF
jgi:trimeric autotransporter adhesin